MPPWTPSCANSTWRAAGCGRCAVSPRQASLDRLQALDVGARGSAAAGQVGPDGMAELQQRADEELAPYRSRLGPRALEQARQRAVTRLVRERSRPAVDRDRLRARMGVRPGAIVTLDVEKPVAGGRMLARLDGQVILVSGAIPGERVSARVARAGKGIALADTIEVLSPLPGPPSRSRRRVWRKPPRARHVRPSAATEGRDHPRRPPAPGADPLDARPGRPCVTRARLPPAPGCTCSADRSASIARAPTRCVRRPAPDSSRRPRSRGSPR